MEDKKLQQAQKVFATLLNTMEQREWKCQVDEEKLLIEFGAVGDDLPMDFRLRVDAEKQMAILYSPLSFHLPEEAIVEGAMVLCMINDHLLDGNFDLDITTGRLCFRIALNFHESLISEGAFNYLLQCATVVVDEYNDKLLMLSKGKLTLEDFAKEFGL